MSPRRTAAEKLAMCGLLCGRDANGPTIGGVRLCLECSTRAIEIGASATRGNAIAAELRETKQMLGEVLLYFTMKRGSGISDRQRLQLKRRVAEILAKTRLPSVERIARPTTERETIRRHERIAGVGLQLRCIICGDPLVYGGRGRPPKWCDAHRPAKFARVNALRAAARQVA